jgi:hypothetical protein
MQRFELRRQPRERTVRRVVRDEERTLAQFLAEVEVAAVCGQRRWSDRWSTPPATALVGNTPNMLAAITNEIDVIRLLITDSHASDSLERALSKR